MRYIITLSDTENGEVDIEHVEESNGWYDVSEYPSPAQELQDLLIDTLNANLAVVIKADLKERAPVLQLVPKT